MTEASTGPDATIIEVWVNCPDEETAATIADQIVGERLAASANIYPAISSRYQWKGSIECASEIPLLLKTRSSLFEKLAERVAKLHPYETPSILGAEVKDAYASYHRWLLDETSGRVAETAAPSLRHRLAKGADLDALRSLMAASIEDLQRPFLTDDQIASSRAIMGLDTQLIDDGTYVVVEIAGQIAGCGGWSRRATLYGSDQSPGRDAALLDPKKDAARIRAMYTDPAFKRLGVGRLIINLCEEAARREGFTRASLMSTLAGEPLYRAAGYDVVERLTDDRGGTPVPLLRMAKGL